jgi:hypothetical protein
VGMTRDQYFEMCETMGYEVEEACIPIEFEDLCVEAQQAMQIYNNLQDNWDYMGGNYIGKNMVGLRDIMELFEIDKVDQRYIYELILVIDGIRAKRIQDQKPKSKSPPQ